jgi:hypothetical protein
MSNERSVAGRLMRFAKWSGAWLGMFAAAADQQVVSWTVYASCPPRTHALAIAVGAVCAAIALLGGCHSLRMYLALPPGEHAGATRRTDRFIAAVSVLLAVFALLYIIFGTTAGLILRCER